MPDLSESSRKRPSLDAFFFSSALRPRGSIRPPRNGPPLRNPLSRARRPAGRQTRVGWSCSCISLALFLAYATTSLIVSLRTRLNRAGSTTSADAATSSNDNGRPGGRQPRIQSSPGADSIVFIALGPAARSASLLYALASVREEGRWDGQVHVLVEREDDLDCLSSYLRQSVTVIATAASPSDSGGGSGSDGGGDKPGGAVVSAKMAKMKLLKLLPPSIRRVVYLDCDVITQKPLGPFLDTIAQVWDELDRNTLATTAAAAVAAAEAEGGLARPVRSVGRPPTSRSQGAIGVEVSTPLVASSGNSIINKINNVSLPPSASTVMIFEDAGGHTIPVCRECDRAHSGVIALARGHSERCLELWHDAFQGAGGGGGDGEGKKGTATDQEALDIALTRGCDARFMARGHLSFMKDAFVMAGLTRKSTFGHFTGLLHPERLGAAYRRFYERVLGRGFEEWGRGEIEACAVT